MLGKSPPHDAGSVPVKLLLYNKRASIPDITGIAEGRVPTRVIQMQGFVREQYRYTLYCPPKTWEHTGD
jgi:hypothetical protein